MAALVPDDLVERLRSVEEELRDRAYDLLREASAAGATRVSADQRKLEQARRAVAKAVGILSGAAGDRGLDD